MPFCSLFRLLRTRFWHLHVVRRQLLSENMQYMYLLDHLFIMPVVWWWSLPAHATATPPLTPPPLNLAMGSLSGVYFEWPVEIFQAICSIRRIECFPRPSHTFLFIIFVVFSACCGCCCCCCLFTLKKLWKMIIMINK